MQITRGKIERAQKVVIYGPEGIGKSSFASQFPNTLFIDTEGSTYKLDVARTPKPSSWTMLFEQVRFIKNNPRDCDTLSIDTADWAEKLATNELCANHQKKGIADFGYGNGYVYLSEEFGRLLNLLEDIVELGINVVITAHAQMRKFEQPDEMGSYDRWEMKLEKKVAPLLREWADMLLFANYKTYVVNVDNQGAAKGKNKAQGGKRVMYTSHHPCWDAKNRHGLAEEIDFSYAAIAHCIPARVPIATKQERYLTPEPNKPAEQPTSTTVEPIREKPDTKIDPPKTTPIDSSIPKPLADLMAANDVKPEEIQQAVASKGYYPKNTPIENYDSNFVSGVLVGAWPAVFKMITDFRDDVPF